MGSAAINLNFAKAPGFVDPRALFTRATTATYISSTGLLKTAPANAARFQYDPVTLACQGYLCEPQRSNYLLRSQEFDNASWTKNATTVTANSVAAPDGTTTADTLAATGTGAYAAQAIAITAGRGIAFSVFLKAGASSHAFLSLNDGTNVIIVWFNLATGTVGTQTGGSGTLLFAQAHCESMGRGWYRCSVEATTATITAVTCLVSPCAADAADSANGNGLYVWGAQAEAEHARNSATSYIPTTSATVTRNADNMVFGSLTPWFNDVAGTLIIDVVNIATPNTYFSVAQPLYGGLGDSGAFADVLYIYRISGTGIRASIGTSLGAGANLDRTVAFTNGGSNKLALAWAQDNISFLVNGGSPVTDNAQSLPVASNLVRMSVGGAPWAATSAVSHGACIFRSWQYYPARLSDADMQALTAA